MDSPIAILTSELFPLFALDAPEICALKCTCKRACGHQWATPLYQIVTNYATGLENGGTFVYWHQYNCVYKITRDMLHRMCLNKHQYMSFQIYPPPATSVRRARHRRKIMRRLLLAGGATFKLPREWAEHDHIVVINGEFYALDIDPDDILPEHLRGHFTRVRFHHQN